MVNTSDPFILHRELPWAVQEAQQRPLVQGETGKYYQRAQSYNTKTITKPGDPYPTTPGRPRVRPKSEHLFDMSKSVEGHRRVSKGVEGCRRGTWDDVEGYNQGRDTTPPLRPRAPRGHRAASNDLRLSKIKITDRKGAEPITKRFFSLCHVHLAKFSRNCLSPLKPFQRRTENAETNGEVEGGGKRGGRAIQGGEGFGGERGVEGSLPSLSGEGR